MRNYTLEEIDGVYYIYFQQKDGEPPLIQEITYEVWLELIR